VNFARRRCIHRMQPARFDSPLRHVTIALQSSGCQQGI
jgi:hypothetical protein